MKVMPSEHMMSGPDNTSVSLSTGPVMVPGWFSEHRIPRGAESAQPISRNWR